MRSMILASIAGVIALVTLSGCAVYATPRHSGVYIAPIPLVVSPIIVSPGWGYPNYHHSRRW
jgi:hypothetical protein